MDQVKIGKFMSELRRENKLTQEQLAEKLNVSRRTVSRWETGNNMPDMDILIELSDLYSVDLREILDGERKTEKMEKQLEETVLKVAEYENDGKRRSTVVVIVCSALGMAALIACLAMTLIDMPDTFLTGFLKGSSLAVAFGALAVSIAYATGSLAKLYSFKKRLTERKEK
ncbi:MAG: helix-turn-helix domain-containing protein [Ruminiclostridium sp.]|nr:helix-turn-helix domain-containing protein [Ruminiclostridium sp.]